MAGVILSIGILVIIKIKYWIRTVSLTLRFTLVIVLLPEKKHSKPNLFEFGMNISIIHRDILWFNLKFLRT